MKGAALLPSSARWSLGGKGILGLGALLQLSRDRGGPGKAEAPAPGAGRPTRGLRLLPPDSLPAQDCVAVLECASVCLSLQHRRKPSCETPPLRPAPTATPRSLCSRLTQITRSWTPRARTRSFWKRATQRKAKKKARWCRARLGRL